MDINQVLDTYDAMFGTYSLEQIDEFLEKNIKKALSEGDVSSIITLVNEMIGFCRDTDKAEKGMTYCSQLITLMRDLEMEGTVPYATSTLNIGNAYRAFGRLEEAMECYQTVQVIYDQELNEYDFSFASLYNNWSLLYQEMGEFIHAKRALYKALEIVSLYDEAKIEQATTHTNLAVTLLRLGEIEEAETHLKQGLEIYKEEGGEDFHYSAALAAAGDACYLRGRQQEAIHYYKKAMEKLEKQVGRTKAYRRIFENCQKAEEALKLQILQREENGRQAEQLQTEDVDRQAEEKENRLEEPNKFENQKKQEEFKAEEILKEQKEPIRKTERTNLIPNIVRLEWQQFHSVQVEGTGADWQNDWKTFQFIRKSQYLTWNQELLVSYLEDLLAAKESGWNVLFPKRQTERFVLQEEIIKIQVVWMQKFSKKYPLIAERARKIYMVQEASWKMSYEIYLREELETYSDQTLELYGQFIVELARKERNLACMIMENIVEWYGYFSLDEVEELLQKNV